MQHNEEDKEAEKVPNYVGSITVHVPTEQRKNICLSVLFYAAPYVLNKQRILLYGFVEQFVIE